MLHFEHSSFINAPVGTVFGFHELPDALERLTPPWQRAEVVRKTGGLRVGAEVVLKVWFGPVPVTWVARHVGYEKDRYFADEQVEGPFAAWAHTHRFAAEGGGTRLTDSVNFALPGGRMAEWLGGWMARGQLRKLFAYRHGVTKEWCEEVEARHQLPVPDAP